MADTYVNIMAVVIPLLATHSINLALLLRYYKYRYFNTHKTTDHYKFIMIKNDENHMHIPFYNNRIYVAIMDQRFLLKQF